MPNSTSRARRSSLGTLQLGRALAALAVVGFHADVILREPEYFGRDLVPALNAGDSGVNYFFVLSGFVLLIAHHKDFGRSTAWRVFAWKRFKRIYPTLWIVLSGALLIFILNPGLGKGPERHVGTVVSAFLTLPAQHDYLLAPEWTLRHEFLFYLVFALALAAPRFGALIAGAWFTGSIIVSFTNADHLLWFAFSPFHLLFLGGLGAAFLYLRGFWRFARTALIVGLILFAACWIAVVRGAADDPRMIVLRGLGAVLIVFGAAVLETQGKIRVPKWMLFLGDASYAIYLVHFPVIFLGADIAISLHHSVGYPGWLAVLVLFIVATLVGIAFHVVVERPLLRLLARWNPRSLTPAKQRESSSV
ncbi:MAG: acyltransferase [Antricoccus sp.]